MRDRTFISIDSITAVTISCKFSSLKVLLNEIESSSLFTATNTGGVCYPTLLRIRLIAAAWCLAAFFVVNAYNTTLISFISSPNLQPVIDSIYEIQKKPELRMVLDKDQYSDSVFSVTAH